MSDVPAKPDRATPAADRTPAQIRADIAATRAEMQRTVDALSAKLDVKSRVTATAASAKTYVASPDNRPQVIAAGVAAVALVALLITRKVRS